MIRRINRRARLPLVRRPSLPKIPDVPGVVAQLAPQNGAHRVGRRVQERLRAEAPP